MDTVHHRAQLILCPRFFNFGTFEGGKGREWPGITTRVCSNIGDRLSYLMHTLGRGLLHEYMHVNDLVWPPLDRDVGDIVYKFYGARGLSNKGMARFNADSYALFASELTWSMLCDRDFEAPVKDDIPKAPLNNIKESRSEELDTNGADTKGSDTKQTESKKLDTQAASTKQQRPRNEIQSVPSLNKRAPFSRPYKYPIPKVEENYIHIDLRDQYLDAHIDALHLCSVVIEQATRDPNRFDKIFREYFKPDDRELVLGKHLLQLQRDAKVA